jgi:dTDP-4-amino-4,6-dideoxygalactose transaminase
MLIGALIGYYWNKRDEKQCEVYLVPLMSVSRPPGLARALSLGYYCRHAMANIHVLDLRPQLLSIKGEKAGVGCMIYYPTPQDLLPVYGRNESPHEASTEAAAQVMSLPVWPELGLEVQEHVAGVLKSCL